MGTAKPTGKSKFRLWKHASDQWCKKYRGQFYYFGSDHYAALKRFAAEWDDITAGRSPKIRAGTTTVADRANSFLTAERERVQAGELSQRSRVEYRAACNVVVEAFGAARAFVD